MTGTGAAATTLSPCTGICTLDPEGDTCLSCKRSLAEIAAWSSLSEEARAQVMRRLAAARAGS